MAENGPMTPMERIDRDAKIPVVLGDLMGPEGNAWAVMASCHDAMRQLSRVMPTDKARRPHRLRPSHRGERRA